MTTTHIYALSFYGHPLVLSSVLDELHQDQVAFFLTCGMTLVIEKLLNLLGCLVQVGLESVKLFLHLLGKIVGAHSFLQK